MIDELQNKLLHIISENTDTYKRVETVFATYGIRLLYIGKVGQVPVDGMSFWIDDNPTVVLTRRLSNIDNFAFSVMHELGHVKLHLKKDDPALINLDGMDFDDKETEANQFARDAFISQDQWDLFMQCISDCNPYSVHLPIAEEARRLGIHPQILFGRYMHDAGLYRLRRVFPTEVN